MDMETSQDYYDYIQKMRKRGVGSLSIVVSVCKKIEIDGETYIIKPLTTDEAPLFFQLMKLATPFF